MMEKGEEKAGMYSKTHPIPIQINHAQKNATQNRLNARDRAMARVGGGVHPFASGSGCDSRCVVGVWV